MSRAQMAVIEMVQGDKGPLYPKAIGVVCDRVVITEMGTLGHLPIVDFVMKGPGGEQYLLSLTGRIVCGIAAAVRGANLRNHGMEEP